MTQDVLTLLEKLRERVVVGFVGGSDLAKQREQLGEDCTDRFDYCFSQNGLVAYRDGELFHTKCASPAHQLARPPERRWPLLPCAVPRFACRMHLTITNCEHTTDTRARVTPHTQLNQRLLG